jgi:PHP family Zn ribbon phosphoesterase
MKIIAHGTRFEEKVKLNLACERCQCRFEVEEGELEGNSTRFCWCPECGESCYVPEREIARQIEELAVARMRNAQ